MPAYVLFSQNGVPLRGSVSSGIHMGWTELAGFDPVPSDGGSPPQMWLLTRRLQSSPALPLRRIAGASFAPGDGQARTSPHGGGVNIGMADGSVRTRSTGLGAAGGRIGIRSGHPEGAGFAMADGSARPLSDSVSSNATEITAEIDLTSAQDNGGELVVLRALVHGVRLVAYAPVAHAGPAGNDVAMEKIVIVHEGITRAGASRLSADITPQVRALLGAYSWAYLLRRPQALEVYDYPGAYAQRFDGVDKGGGS